jgi:hypothetical protein
MSNTYLRTCCHRSERERETHARPVIILLKTLDTCNSLSLFP